MARQKNILQFTESLGAVSGATESEPINATGGQILSCQAVVDVESGAKSFDSPDTASLTDQSLTYTSVDASEAANDITIEITAPVSGTHPLAVSVVDDAISVSLESADGAIGSSLFATYASSIDATTSDGDGTGLAINGAAISGGLLDLTGGAVNKYVRYDAVDNWDGATTFTARLSVKPNYSGAPATRQTFLTRSVTNTSDLNNLIQIFHESDGNLAISIFDGDANNLGSGNLGAWSPTSGTTYEIELDCDILTGATRLFVNGTQLGSTVTGTGTFSVSSGYIYVGTGHDHNASELTNFYASNLAIFPTVQHTSNYVAPSEYFAILSTGDDVKAAVNADVDASALVVVSGTNAAVLTTLDPTNLEGGTDGDVNVPDSEITILSHGYDTGAEGQLTETGTLPAPLATGTDYYVIVVNDNTIQLAASAEDAAAGVFIELEDAGSDGNVSTFTPSSISGASIQLQKSNDGVNWSDEGAAVNITADGSAWLEKEDPTALYYKAVIEITDGSFDCDLWWLLKGIDG